MRGSLAFDPEDYDYGPASRGIRNILVEWARIDWFEPSPTPDDVATGLFCAHHALARAAAPELYGRPLTVRMETGGWEEFAALCRQVQRPEAWDWKFSVLKQLSKRHREACGWDDDQVPLVASGPRRPGDLWVRLKSSGDQPFFVFTGALPAIELGGLAGQHADSAGFYRGHAEIDAIFCLRWQLAEGHGDLSGNPFHALGACYRAGVWPFHLDAETVVMFRFAGG